MSRTKSELIQFRVRPEHRRIIYRAAEERGETVTSLLTRAALDESSRILVAREEPERERVTS